MNLTSMYRTAERQTAPPSWARWERASFLSYWPAKCNIGILDLHSCCPRKFGMNHLTGRPDLLAPNHRPTTPVDIVGRHRLLRCVSRRLTSKQPAPRCSTSSYIWTQSWWHDCDLPKWFRQLVNPFLRSSKTFCINSADGDRFSTSDDILFCSYSPHFTVVDNRVFCDNNKSFDNWFINNFITFIHRYLYLYYEIITGFTFFMYNVKMFGI